MPLVISVPGQVHKGEKTNALVELLDMYPTLAELCNLQPPVGLQGRSFVPLLSKPGQPWKTEAYTTYYKPLPELGVGFGRAIRTDRFRFVEWTGSDPKKHIFELYDEQVDPLEKTNIADRPEHADLIKRLSVLLNLNVINDALNRHQLNHKSASSLEESPQTR